MTNLQHDTQALINQFVRLGIRYDEGVREFKKRYLIVVLAEFNWNQLMAARALDIHRNTLHRQLHQLRIDPRIEKQLTKRKPIRKANAQSVQIEHTA